MESSAGNPQRMRRERVHNLNRKRIAAACLIACALVNPCVASAQSSAAPDGAGAAVVAPEERLQRNQIRPEHDHGDESFRADQTRGLDGEGEAALRIASMCRAVEQGFVPPARVDPRRG